MIKAVNQGDAVHDTGGERSGKRSTCVFAAIMEAAGLKKSVTNMALE
jgi:hypothetical protein